MLMMSKVPRFESEQQLPQVGHSENVQGSTMGDEDEEGDSDIFVSSDEEGVDDSEGNRGSGLYGSGEGEGFAGNGSGHQNNKNDNGGEAPQVKLEQRLSARESKTLLKRGSGELSLVSDIVSAVTSGASSLAEESQVSALIEEAMMKMKGRSPGSYGAANTSKGESGHPSPAAGDDKNERENVVTTAGDAIAAMQKQVHALLTATSPPEGTDEDLGTNFQHQTLEMIQRQLKQFQRQQEEVWQQQKQQHLEKTATNYSLADNSGPTEADTIADTFADFGQPLALTEVSRKDESVKPVETLKSSVRKEEDQVPPIGNVDVVVDDLDVNTVVRQAQEVLDEESVAVAMIAGAKAAATAVNEAEDLYVSERPDEDEVESILEKLGVKKEQQNGWICSGCHTEHTSSLLKFCGMCGTARPPPSQASAFPRRTKSHQLTSSNNSKPPRKSSLEYSTNPIPRKGSKEYTKSPLTRAASGTKIARIPSKEYRRSKSLEEDEGKADRPGLKKSRSRSKLIDSPTRPKTSGRDGELADTKDGRPSRPGIKKSRSRSKLVDSPSKGADTMKMPKWAAPRGDNVSLADESMFSADLELALIKNAAAHFTEGAEVKTVEEVHADYRASKSKLLADSSDDSSASGAENTPKKGERKKKKNPTPTKTPKALRKPGMSRSASSRTLEKSKNPHRSKATPTCPRRTKSAPDDDFCNDDSSDAEPLPRQSSRGSKPKHRHHDKKGHHRHGSHSGSPGGKRGRVRVESPRRRDTSPEELISRSTKSPTGKRGIFGMAGAAVNQITKTPGRAIKSTLNMANLSKMNKMPLDDDDGIHRHIGELKFKPKGLTLEEPKRDNSLERRGRVRDDDVSVDDSPVRRPRGSSVEPRPGSRTNCEDETPATFLKDMKKKTDMWKKLFQKSASTRDLMANAQGPNDVGARGHTRIRRASLGASDTEPLRGPRRSLIRGPELESSSSHSPARRRGGSPCSYDSGSYSSDSDADLSPERELRPRPRGAPPRRTKSSDGLELNRSRRSRQPRGPRRDWNKRRRGSVERRKGGVNNNDALKQSLAQLPDDPIHAVREDFKKEIAKKEVVEGMKTKAEMLRQRFQKAGSQKNLASLTPTANKAKAQMGGFDLALDDDL